MRKLAKIIIRGCCAVVLAMACVPAASFTAFADVVPSGSTFVVDDLEYKVTVSSVRYVQLKGVVNPSERGKIIDIPQNVTYDGETYHVIGIGPAAFAGCTQVEDIRIPDIGEGMIESGAFNDCSSLQVIHMMGDFAFSQPMHYKNNFGSLASVKFIVHKGNWCYNEVSGVDFPSSSQTYYGIDFIQNGTAQTVFVAGPQYLNGRISGGTTSLSLLDPSSVDVFCDKEEGQQALCAVSSVPSLASGNDSWLVVDSNGDKLSVDGSIRSTGTATAISSDDLRGATLTVSDLYVNGDPLSLEASLVNSAGKALTLGEDYTVRVEDSDGAVVDEVANPGAYTVVATGIGKYSQETTCTLMVFAPSAAWYRSLSSDDYDLVKTISSQASLIKSQANSDASLSVNPASITTPQLSGNNASCAHRASAGNGTVKNSVRVLLNPSDYASSVVGVSLAGLFDSTVIACPASLTAGELKDSVKEQLSAVRNGVVLVMGSSSQISDDVKTAVACCVDGGASRVGGTAKTAAEEAVAAYQFVRGVESGKYSMSLPDDYVGYGDTVVLVPENSSSTAFVATAWAYSNNALVLFCKADGSVDDATNAVLNDVDSKGQRYFNKVIVAGASSSAVSAVAPKLDVEEWEAASDATKSASQWVAACVADDTLSYGVSVFANTSSSWGVLAAAACTAGCHGGALFLADATKGDDALLELVEPIAWKISYGVLAGGLNQFSQNLFERILRLWDFDTDAASLNMRFSEVTVLTPQIEATGKALSPQVQVVDKTGKLLAEGVDYKLSFLDNATGKTVNKENLVSPGSYTVVATGTYNVISGGFSGSNIESGYYKGSRSASFKITGSLPSSPSAATTKVSKVSKPGKASVKSLTRGKKKLTVKWKAVSVATKYQVSYRVKGTKKWKTKTVSTKKVKLTLSKLKKGKVYQVRVRAGNRSGWGSWSAIKTSKKIK